MSIGACSSGVYVWRAAVWTYYCDAHVEFVMTDVDANAECVIVVPLCWGVALLIEAVAFQGVSGVPVYPLGYVGMSLYYASAYVAYACVLSVSV